MFFGEKKEFSAAYAVPVLVIRRRKSSIIHETASFSSISYPVHHRSYPFWVPRYAKLERQPRLWSIAIRIHHLGGH